MRRCFRLFSSVSATSREDEFLFLGNKMLLEKLKDLSKRFAAIGAQLEEASQHELVVKLKKEQTDLSLTASLVESLLGLEKAFDECEEIERVPNQDPEMLKFVVEEKARLHGEITAVEQVKIKEKKNGQLLNFFRNWSMQFCLRMRKTRFQKLYLRWTLETRKEGC